jgi:hypothetical protein
MRRSILTEKVARRGLHVQREYVVNPFEQHDIDDLDSDAIMTAMRKLHDAEHVRERGSLK